MSELGREGGREGGEGEKEKKEGGREGWREKMVNGTQVARCVSLRLSISGSYVLQYLGGNLYLASFVTQALVQVSDNLASQMSFLHCS